MKTLLTAPIEQVVYVFLLFLLPGNVPSQRLPFTIPELVHASPCRSSDGVFYTGKHLSGLWVQVQQGLGPHHGGASWAQDSRQHTLSQAISRAGPLSTSTGRKQDAWFVVDPESGKRQMTLTTEGPSTPRLYIGRTRESGPSGSWQLLSKLNPGQSVNLSVCKHCPEH